MMKRNWYKKTRLSTCVPGGVCFFLCLFVCFLYTVGVYSFDRDLESVYRAVFSDDMGYTLLGAKPISHTELSNVCLYVSPRGREKSILSLQAIFAGSDEYVFKVIGTPEEGEIELIHKSALRELMLTSHVLRDFIKKNFANEEKFLQNIEDKKTSVFDFVPCIRGILFGYGDENAQHFCRYVEVARFLKKYPIVRMVPDLADIWGCLMRPGFPEGILLPYTIVAPKVGGGFASLEAEWECLQKLDLDLKKVVNERIAKPPFFLSLPIYRCKKSPESDALLEKYIQARSMLAKLFMKKSYQRAVKGKVRKG